jgi:hypothetical protein
LRQEARGGWSFKDYDESIPFCGFTAFSSCRSDRSTRSFRLYGHFNLGDTILWPREILTLLPRVVVELRAGHLVQPNAQPLSGGWQFMGAIAPVLEDCDGVVVESIAPQRMGCEVTRPAIVVGADAASADDGVANDSVTHVDPLTCISDRSLDLRASFLTPTRQDASQNTELAGLKRRIFVKH